MDKSHNSLPKAHVNGWRFLPYALFGIFAFSLTSASSLPSLLKTYLMILEIPIGLIVLYLGLPKLVKLNQNQHQSSNYQPRSIKL